MKTTVITGPGGEQTVVRQRRSYGCLTFLAVLVLLAVPAGWPAPWNGLAYGLVALTLLLGLLVRLSRR